MRVRQLDNRDAQVLAEFLSPRIDTSLFLYANSARAGLVDQGERYQGTYLGAFEGERLVGVVAHYWNGMIITQAPSHLEELTRAVSRASSREVTGVIGPLEQALGALSTLGIERDQLQADSPEVLYSLSLDALKEPLGREGQRLEARIPIKADLPQLIEWTLAYGEETLGTAPTATRREEVEVNLTRSIVEETSYVLLDRGELVSMTGFTSEVAQVVQIGGVWTPPELRGRGYARSAVARHLLSARDRGVERAILFTAQDNHPAQRAYEALGFEKIGDYAIMIVK